VGRLLGWLVGCLVGCPVGGTMMHCAANLAPAVSVTKPREQSVHAVGPVYVPAYEPVVA